MAGLQQQQQGDLAHAVTASTDAVASIADSSSNRLEEPDHSSSNWYFPREYIEKSSPSRKDGIDLKRETYFRKSYCTFLQDLGMRLKVPQVTIATAIVFCHRFFLRQSHLKNDRYLIATTCMFLAGKVEETPQKLCDVIYLSYEIRNKKDPTAVQRIKQKDVYEPQKELVLLGERLVLATLGFDLNIHHPYKPLVAAIKKFKVAQNALAQVAWNFVNDGLRTSLCLQFKPHHIAAGAIFLAAKFLKVKLPSEGEKVWWQEFDVTPRQLEEVSNQMLELYEQNKEVPTSRTSDPSASIGSVRKKATGDVPSSSAAVEKFGDIKNLSSHKRSSSEAFPPASAVSDKMKDEHSIGDAKSRMPSNTKVDADVTVTSLQSGHIGEETNPKVIDGNATPGGDVPFHLVEATAKNAVGELKPQASSSSALEAEISSGRIGDSRSTEDTAHVSGMNLPVVDEVVSNQESSDPAHQKTDWADLADVNIDRVKAAIKRRKQEVRTSISKRELTDEEELLEMDLENGHRDERHDNQDFEYPHNQDDPHKKDDQSEAGYGSCKKDDDSFDKCIENGGDSKLQYAYNKQDLLHHHQKFDGDVDHCQHIDMEKVEGHKKPRIEY